jgi:hypothetical protein
MTIQKKLQAVRFFSLPFRSSNSYAAFSEAIPFRALPGAHKGAASGKHRKGAVRDSDLARTGCYGHDACLSDYRFASLHLKGHDELRFHSARIVEISRKEKPPVNIDGRPGDIVRIGRDKERHSAGHVVRIP